MEHDSESNSQGPADDYVGMCYWWIVILVILLLFRSLTLCLVITGG